MANIGATTAFYKVETSLTRANNEVSKSMERLATGRQNANAGDRSSYVAMADTFRLDFVGTKAGIKGASVVMGYLETGMRVLDSASSLLARMQELAVLGANDTNTTADHEAINLEAEAIADEFNRLLTTSTYKGRDVFVENASSLYVSMGGRDQEMTFGIGRIDYSTLYLGTAQTVGAATSTSDGPNKDAEFNLAHLPSDAVVTKEMGKSTSTGIDGSASGLTASKTYVITTLDQDANDTDLAATEDSYVNEDGTAGTSEEAAFTLATADGVSAIYTGTNTDDVAVDTTETNGTAGTNAAVGDVFVIDANGVAAGDISTDFGFKQVNDSSTRFLAGHEYEIVSLGDSTGLVGTTATDFDDATAIARGVSGISDGDQLIEGQKFTIDEDASIATMAHLNSMTENMTFRMSSDTLTADIEAMQGLLNTARVQAGSQYGALESAVNYTTDLTAQYELGYNTVNDVNFSMETAHLARNQILQQAATAMLAQANSGQQGLLQLIS